MMILHDKTRKACKYLKQVKGIYGSASKQRINKNKAIDTTKSEGQKYNCGCNKKWTIS